MITDALHTKTFGVVISFMFGLALVLVLVPMCRGKDCMLVKAPPVHEVRETVYKIGSKCYQFEAVGMDCPVNGKAIEAFENISKA